MRASRMRQRALHEWQYLPPSRTSNSRAIWQRGDGARVLRGLHGWAAIKPNGEPIRVEQVSPPDLKKPIRRFNTAVHAKAFLDELWRQPAA